jgi:hypothetical protein
MLVLEYLSPLPKKEATFGINPRYQSRKQNKHLRGAGQRYK